MSRHINVNPGNYKVAGRERQGEAIHQSSEKGAYTQQREEARRDAIEFEAGPPAWETTPPNLEIVDKPKPRTRRKSRRTRSGKRTRKAASTRKTGRVMKKAARRSAGSSTKARRTRRARP